MKTAICKVETLTEKYILLDSLLFKLVTTHEKERALLPMPEICIYYILYMSHIIQFRFKSGLVLKVDLILKL